MEAMRWATPKQRGPKVASVVFQNGNEFLPHDGLVGCVSHWRLPPWLPPTQLTKPATRSISSAQVPWLSSAASHSPRGGFDDWSRVSLRAVISASRRWRLAGRHDGGRAASRR